LTLLSRPCRARRNGEWSTGKAVTFIVTLAATRSVTLAARSAGMSRKSAYALKARDPAFARAWNAALAVKPSTKAEGDKAKRATPSTWSSSGPQTKTPPHRHAELDSASMNTADSRSRESVFVNSDFRQNDELKLRREHLLRDRFFARLAARPTGQ
jgi:hypothetical protein